MNEERVSGRRTGEWLLWEATAPLERAEDAQRLLASGIAFGPFVLDHVGWCEARSDVERITEALALPHETFPSVVLARELSLDLRITRVRVGLAQHLELFWLPGGEPPTAALLGRSHVAFRARDQGAVERVAARFGARVHEAGDGTHLSYLLPWLELIA